MWTRRVLLATIIAAAAMTLPRQGTVNASYLSAPNLSVSSLR